MPKFIKKCFCKKAEVEFRTAKDFNEKSVSTLYCPLCVDRAANDSLIIHITGVPGMIGIWGIKYNSSVLKTQDKKFRSQDSYYVDLFKNGQCIFEAVWKKRKMPVYEIFGIKKSISKLKQEQPLSGPDFLMIRKGGKPHKLPKKTHVRGEESPTSQSGYKGHR